MTLSSFQDIATAQIAPLTQELKATQGISAMFLVKYETTERERAWLYEELLEHQTMAIQEREAEHTRHMVEFKFSTQHNKSIPSTTDIPHEHPPHGAYRTEKGSQCYCELPMLQLPNLISKWY